MNSFLPTAKLVRTSTWRRVSWEMFTWRRVSYLAEFPGNYQFLLVAGKLSHTGHNSGMFT